MIAGRCGFAALILLAACEGPEPADIGECWVYQGLSEEETARMEAWCNEYAVCSVEDRESCAGPTGAAAQ